MRRVGFASLHWNHSIEWPAADAGEAGRAHSEQSHRARKRVQRAPAKGSLRQEGGGEQACARAPAGAAQSADRLSWRCAPTCTMTLRCRGGRGGPAAALCRCPAGLEELKEVLKALEKPFNKKMRLSQGPENSHP